MLVSSSSFPFWGYWWHHLNFVWISKQVSLAIRFVSSHWPTQQLLDINDINDTDINEKIWKIFGYLQNQTKYFKATAEKT